jgi:site-specific DNA-adenine methylase
MATLRITTQYYENYSDSQTPHWKPKGGQTFIIKDIEGDMIMYCDNLKEVCSNLISAKSNIHFKYDYLEHTVDFIEDEEISVAELTKEVRDQFNGEGKYAPNDIPGFEGTLEKLNELTIQCSKELDNEWANESE